MRLIPEESLKCYVILTQLLEEYLQVFPIGGDDFYIWWALELDELFPHF